MSAPLLVGLCFASAIFYVLPSIVMKVSGNTSFLVLALPVSAALALAAWLESLALPANRIGIVLILILGFEVLLTTLVAITLGERYGLREVIGLTAIVGGVAVLFHGDGPRLAD